MRYCGRRNLCSLCWEPQKFPKGSLFQPCSKLKYSFICFAYYEAFCLSNFCLPGSFNFISSQSTSNRAVGKFFGIVREGIRRSRPPRLSQLFQLLSSRHHWANVFTVRRQGPNWAERFHDKINGNLLYLDRDGLRLVVPYP